MAKSTGIVTPSESPAAAALDHSRRQCDDTFAVDLFLTVTEKVESRIGDAPAALEALADCIVDQVVGSDVATLNFHYAAWYSLDKMPVVSPPLCSVPVFSLAGPFSSAGKMMIFRFDHWI